MTGKHGIDQDVFVPLGDEPGPALPVRAEQAEAVARAVVRRARRKRKPGLSVALQVAAGVLLALLAGGGAVAAVTSYLAAREAATRQQGEQAAAPPRVAPPRRARAKAPRIPAPIDAPSAGVPGTAAEPVAAPGARAHRGPAPRTASGGELLERANRLRAQGEFARAERLYSRVMRRAGEPDDAYVATVAAAALRLEHKHSPRAALALYRRALRMRPRGPLAASARYGIAQCHRALGEPQAEARALSELLTAHPGHLLRSRAEARLRALGTSP